MAVMAPEKSSFEGKRYRFMEILAMRSGCVCVCEGGGGGEGGGVGVMMGEE